MVERLAQAQQGLHDDQATDYDDSRIRGDVAFYQAAVARIDWRLKQLGWKRAFTPSRAARSEDVLPFTYNPFRRGRRD
jgi:hypothetical protein